ncbi:MAG TPA: aspartate--tRNA ligase [Acidimicrobiales bacterium]|nr:aspartate--tRNA ligase [Acidimicrobiales bacterium]
MTREFEGVLSTPVPVGMRTHYCGTLGVGHIGQTVSVCGWVAHRREHGEHLAFVDLRDHTGLVQCVVDGAHTLRAEFVVRITGVVRARPAGTENPALSTGTVEIGDSQVEILNASEPPPFVLDGHSETDEAVRLRYRFVDLRSQRMQRNLRLRATISSALRASMLSQGFTEIETPLLWTPTPEGAREFAVPSRLQHGSFYVLPQSPQIAKQLTMVGGFDRYFQIARCLRDEDLRADRQFEFTQLDIEASFVTERDVRQFVASAVAHATRAVDGQPPDEIVEMTWHEALDRYGTDKPDLRFALELVDLTKVLDQTTFNAFKAPCIKAIRVPGGGDYGRTRLDGLIESARALGAKGLVWMRAVALAEGVIDLESPIAKFLSEKERTGIVEMTGALDGDLVLIVADVHEAACRILGQLRIDIGRPPVHEGPRRLCWVIDFPMFEGFDEEGRLLAAHHPFTMPHPDDVERLESDPLSVRAQSYDLVLNGWELGSGSIRIHREDIQQRVFEALGISPQEVQARFGFLLGAFKYGAPPHGGFAVGLDRFVAILAGEENIREVIAFPKTQSGTDLMTGAPRPITARQMGELGIRAIAPKKGTVPPASD